MPSAIEKSTCAKAETTKIRSQSFIKMLEKCNSLKYDRIVPLHGRGIIPRIKKYCIICPCQHKRFFSFSHKDTLAKIFPQLFGYPGAELGNSAELLRVKCFRNSQRDRARKSCVLATATSERQREFD